MVWGEQYESYPQQAQNMDNIVDLSTYTSSSNVALTTDGNIKTWKDIHSYHQIPVFKEAMPDSATIQDITSDCDKTCVALKDGTVWCWGSNIDGMHGLSSSTPLQITGLFNISAFETSCYSGTETALRNDGTVWNWGENKMGQLGNGMTENSAIPVQVKNLENVISVSSDSWHSLALKNDGTVWAWGINDFGQLGDATTIDRNLPVRVLNLDNIVEISTAISHCLALKNDGTVWAWGANWSGLLGDGTTIERHKPVQLSSLSDIVAVRSNISLNLALKSDGTVWTWGNSQNNVLIPWRIPDLENIVEIDISGESCIARASNADIWVWGRVWNDYSFDYSYYPILLKNIPGVSKIKAGYACFYFFMEDDTVWMWGHEKANIPSDIFIISVLRFKSRKLQIK
ncbi:MAG: regulator of chromosome condensation RCC1 [Candidatus Magnetoglobus multicellularis str. Araruama]|uniref:Regulator of chromosome condensation RCC1 n=1 Tax=Candidatus Magnetoglobus multicellularis str. Araruama TaxID=890399 RepID=A0A1V1NZF5_9BACT|nr:MAG: regulator of chromosome condensation RCC1 [Candidatus Magnetoglobus multicellularis str. Araruama]